jgi:DNA topoisomerase-1
VEVLEKHGIGRPSTYAPTISTIIDRGYVERIEGRRLKPKEIAFLVNDLLVEHFPQIVDYTFTAHMEDELDSIAEGKKEWIPVIREFYTPFRERLTKKYDEVSKVTEDEPTSEICDKCGSPMIIKMGRFGKFLGCSAFPKCHNIKPLKRELKTIGMKCPKCGSTSSPQGGGEVIEKRTKRGRRFWGCSRWPDCDYASWTNPLSSSGSSSEKAQDELKDSSSRSTTEGQIQD